MDIKQYLKCLNASTHSALELVKNYSTEELLFKQEGECSIANILEHICISDERTITLLKTESNNIAATGELYGDEGLKKIVADHTGWPKITAGEMLELKGSIIDFSSFEKVFLMQRSSLHNSLQSGEIIISNKIYPHLYLKDMTVTDWLKYLVYHTIRRLNDVKDAEMHYKRLANPLPVKQ
jgi:hypothetical protein